MDRQALLQPAAAPVALDVRVAEGADAAAPLDDEWDELVGRQDVPAPTSGAVWLRALVRSELEQGRHPLVVTVSDGERLVAGGAFDVRRARPAGRPAVARWLGDDAFWYSPELLVDDGVAGAGAALLDGVLSRVDILHLACAAGGATTRTVLAGLPWALVEPAAEGYLLPLPPPRLAHAEARSRHSLRRAARHGAQVEVRRLRRPDDVAAALDRLLELHSERWSGRAEAGVSLVSSPAAAAWHREAVGAAAVLGRARLIELTEDGEVVATVLGLVHGRGGVFYTTAFRPGGRVHGPGHVVLLELAKELQAAGATTMDLGWGAGETGGPKERLGPLPVQVVRVVAARRRRAQWAAAQALRARERGRRG